MLNMKHLLIILALFISIIESIEQKSQIDLTVNEEKLKKYREMYGNQLDVTHVHLSPGGL